MKTDNKSKTGDLRDSKKDQRKLKDETITMDMPEVKGIPDRKMLNHPSSARCRMLPFLLQTRKAMEYWMI